MAKAGVAREFQGTHPALRWETITPHDTNELDPRPRALLVTAAGTVACVGLDDVQVDIPLNANTIYPLAPKIIHTDSTATGIIALY